jgi:hypothetical protein
VSAHPSSDEIVGSALLDASDPGRLAVEAHARDCADCGVAWASAQKLVVLMDGLAPPPAPSDAALQRIAARIHGELDAEKKSAPAVRDPEPEVAGSFGWLTGLSIVAVGAAGFAFVPHDASTLRYLVAASAIGVAAALGSMAARSGWHARLATGLALGLSIALGAVDLRAFTLELGHAESCYSTHVIACLLPLAAAAWLTMSKRGSTSPFHAAAAAACGAIAGQAVLLTACASEESLLHVVFFHVAGVLTAAALGAGSGRVASRLAASRG